MDFVIRTNYSSNLENRIESIAKSRKELSEIRDQFFKAKGKALSDFSPSNVIVRRRTFPERETIVKINIIQKDLGYTDTKEEIESLKDYEKWGGFTSYAVEYEMEIGERDVSVLIENFSFGKKYIKIESPSKRVLENLVRELDINRSKIIEKNSAELLAEEMNKI